MTHYSWLSFVVILFTLIRMVQHKDILVFGIGGMAIALILANLLAVVSLRRQVAEIFFLQEHFALITVWDVLFTQETKTFPLHLANPSREADQVSFHYFDRVVVLKSADWDTFELICSYLSYRPQI